MKNNNVKNNELVNQQLSLPLDPTGRRQALDNLKEIIRNAYTKADEACLDVCFALYEIKRLELYREDGFKNIVDFAQNTFDIQKTRTYEYLKVVEILGDIKDDGSCTELKPEYRSYSVSKICLLPNVTEADRNQMNPNWTVNAIKCLIPKKNANTKTKKAKQKTAETEINATEASESNNLNEVTVLSETENVVVSDNVSEPKSFSFTTSKDRLSELTQILKSKLTELSFTPDFTERDILFLIHIE